MSNSNNSGCNCRIGCGCLTTLLEFIAFMLICNFIGCEWAERGTEKMINYVHRTWNATGK